MRAFHPEDKARREHHKPNETGKDVLARIEAARQAFKSSKNGRRFVQDEAFDDCLLDLPAGWEWSSLGAIGEIVGGVTVDKKRRPNDSSSLTSGSVSAIRTPPLRRWPGRAACCTDCAGPPVCGSCGQERTPDRSPTWWE